MSDAVRKRTLADWVVKTKKQVVKLYAVTKWSRDAETIQKCMVRVAECFAHFVAYLCSQNITSFLGAHHRQLDLATNFLLQLRDELGRLRYATV